MAFKNDRQRKKVMMTLKSGIKPVNSFKAYSPEQLRSKAVSVYMTDKVGSSVIDAYLQDNLDLVNHKDYELITNQTLSGKPVNVLVVLTQKAGYRIADSRISSQSKIWDMNITTIKDLTDSGYGLWK
ncbi:hypothetical protein GQ472_01760 [archaeon]|nr:hypothetical protein [archaeon]